MTRITRPKFLRGRALAAALALLLLQGCASSEEKAAEAAGRSAQAFAQGNFLQARIDILKAVEHRDDIPEYWMALARIQLALRQFGGAYQAFTRVIELEPNNIEALQNLAEIALGSRRLKEAGERADAVLALDPSDIRARLVKGYVALRQKDFAEAEKWADEIMVQYPLEDPPLVLKTQSLFESGRQAEAIELIEKAIPVRGATRPKLQTLIELYTKLGDRAGIERTYMRFTELEPDNIDIKLLYATELYRNGKTAGADTVLARLLADNQVPERVADVMIAAGDRSRNAAGLEQLASGAGPEVQIAIARVALEKGYAPLTVQLLQPYIGQAMNPSVASATAMYAEAKNEIGERDEALRLAQQVIKFDEANPRALRVRALVSLERGDLNQALADAGVLVRDQPTMAANRTLIARIHAARGNNELAASSFREAFNDLPGNEDVLRDYVAFLIARKNPMDAARVAEEFIKRNPDSSSGWRTLAGACRALGDANCIAQANAAVARLEMAQVAVQHPA